MSKLALGALLTGAVAVAAILSAAAVAVVGCSNRPPPRDLALEVRRASGRSAPIVPAALRVVTYNVHGIDGDAIAGALAAQPATTDADVYLLQEVERRAGERQSRACAARRSHGAGLRVCAWPRAGGRR